MRELMLILGLLAIGIVVRCLWINAREYAKAAQIKIDLDNHYLESRLHQSKWGRWRSK